MELPTDKDLSGATFSLWVLPLIYRFHPIKLVNGILGNRKTNARLQFEDIVYVSQECFTSRESLFLDTKRSYFKNARTMHIRYAVAIEWLEAAEV